MLLGGPEERVPTTGAVEEGKAGGSPEEELQTQDVPVEGDRLVDVLDRYRDLADLRQAEAGTLLRHRHAPVGPIIAPGTPPGSCQLLGNPGDRGAGRLLVFAVRAG